MTTRDLVLGWQGQLTVKVARPLSQPLPSDMVNTWSGHNKQATFYLAATPLQDVPVSYEVFKDTSKLASVKHRASVNRSGSAVLGQARAVAGHEPTIDLNPRVLAAFVRRAANNTDHRMTDGPLVVRVKLLEQPMPAFPTCAHCGSRFDVHTRLEEHVRGKFIKEGRSGHYDPDFPRIDAYYLCPDQSRSRAEAERTFALHVEGSAQGEHLFTYQADGYQHYTSSCSCGWKQVQR